MPNLQSLISNLKSGNDERAEAAALEISFAGKEAIPVLEELLDSADADQRWWATRSLAGIAAPEAHILLLRSLQDEDINVRQCAALALREQPVPEAIPALIAALDDPDRMLSRLAADALIAAGDASVAALIEVLENGEQRAQREAARALALIGDTRAIPVMFEIWEHSSAFVQYWIEEGFKRMGVGMTFFSPE